MIKYFQHYIILRDYLHKKLHFEKGNGLLHTLVLSAARLLVPLSVIVSGILTFICMAYGFLILGSLFAIILVGIVYGIQKKKVWMHELMLVIGVTIAAVNGITAFLRTLFYTSVYHPSGDLSSIIISLVFLVVGIIIIMTANSRNFDIEITNPNKDKNKTR